MSHSLPFTALIIEPNEKLTHPYNLLPSKYHITRVSTIAEAIEFVGETLPRLVLLSASFEAKDSVAFLEKLRMATHTQLPRLLFVVDFACPLSSIPGTTWGGSAGVTSVTCTDDQFARLV